MDYVARKKLIAGVVWGGGSQIKGSNKTIRCVAIISQYSAFYFLLVSSHVLIMRKTR
jgi:hypothetical protein